MARKVTWSYEATEDLDALAEYIAKDSSFYAAAPLGGILEK
jgi:plasmid stabilization system protein ParE